MSGALLFALTAVAMWMASLRVAARWVGDGWNRVAAAAAVFASAAAALPVLAGTSPLVLAGVSLALSAMAARAAGPPARRLLESAPAGALAAGGAGLVYAVQLLAAPEVRTDSFHLVEVVRWLHAGTPGSVEPVIAEFPAGAYPLVNELVLTWGVGIARAFSPVALWSAALVALLAGSTFAALRGWGAERSRALLATATVVTVVAGLSAVEGAGTDLPAVTWLAVAAALVSRGPHPGAALLAVGLAAGTKTTAALPGALLVAASLRHWRPRGAEWAALVLAAGLALAWPARNLLDHGSPLWPFSDFLGLGDPLPYILSEMQTPFLSRPVASLRAYLKDDLPTLVRMAIPFAGALAVALTARERRARRAAFVAGGLLALWAVSPLSGVTSFGGVSSAFLKYALPAVLAAVVAVALSRAPWSGAVLVLTLLASATVLDRSTAFPSAPEMIATLLAGAAVAWWLWRRPPALSAAPLAAAAVVAIALGVQLAAPRYDDPRGWQTYLAPVLAFLHHDGRFLSGDQPVLVNWRPDGRLAGPRLEHDVRLLRRGDACAGAWLVVIDPRLVSARQRPVPAGRCTAGRAPVHDDGAWKVYAP